MLGQEDNELITRVGPGTPGGDLLRRYWHPVAAVAELTPERPKKRVKVMGEELVLFRSPDGSYGLVEEHCSHRGASLYYGFLEDACIRCPYHGWLYDQSGQCVEQPFEPAQSMMKHMIRHPAYPVEELGGLLFAYMGPPEKQTWLPRWDMLVRPDGKRSILIHDDLQCNWVQAEENTADVTHIQFLHMRICKEKGIIRADAPAGSAWVGYGFQPFEWGLLKSWQYEGDPHESGWGRLLVFPNMLRWGLEMHWRVPIDDTHTRMFCVYFMPTPDGSIPSVDAGSSQMSTAERPGTSAEMELAMSAGTDVPFAYEESWRKEDGDYHLNTFWAQDGMAWETQGPIMDRTKEHIGASDVGVAMFRDMLKEQLNIVQAGGDPIALAREPHDMIDLHQWMPEGWIGMKGLEGLFLPSDQVFDNRYVTFDLPTPVAL